MPTPRKIVAQGKAQQIFYMNETLLRKLKAYAIETGKPFEKLIQEPFSKFEQELILISLEIDKRRIDAIEASRISAENPLKVVGHEVQAF